MSGIELRVLGPLEALRDGRPVALGGPKERTILALLAQSRGRLVRTETFVDALWGERPPSTAVKTLQKHISLLRAALGEPRLVVTRPGGYALTLDPDRLDAARFEHLLDAALAADRAARAVDFLEDALALWHGDPLTELGDLPSAVAERARLAERRMEATEELMEARLALGGHHALTGRLEELVELHPLRERLWGQLMLALYRSGRQADALAAYQRLRATLAENLGIEPSVPLRELEHRILRQDRGLHASPVRPEPSSSASTNLPAALSSFVGREAELRRLAPLVADSRLLTLVGVAGAGKTRLAIEVAGRAIDRFPDGTWFVDLAPLRSPDEVATAVADQFGVKGHPGRPVESVLLEYLASRRLQVVLDNCEHLVDAVAGLAGSLLRKIPGLWVLATSREPLRIHGETTFEVPPLPLPEGSTYEEATRSDAVRLFVERSQATVPGFGLTPDNAPAVVDVCRRLDGLPLAIELAAARVRTFTPEELGGLLDQRFAVLGSPSRADPARHQTLRAAVDWSFDLLSPQQRTLLLMLSVFRGGFDLEAVSQVCCVDPSCPADGLTFQLPELVDRSLVVVDHRSAGRTRYRLLETIREYSQERLGPDETARLRNAHAEYYCLLAERAEPRIRGPEQQHWLRHLQSNYDNLRDALRWGFAHRVELGIRLAVALAFYWDLVGPRAEAQEWLSRAVALTDVGNAHLHIAARLAASDLFSSTVASHALVFAKEALAEAERVGDERSTAAALRALCWARTLHGEYDAAAVAGRRALEMWEQLDEPWETAWTLERLGQAYNGDPDRSLHYLEQSLWLYRQCGDAVGAATVQYKIAEVGVRGSRSLQALEEGVRESLAVHEAMGSINGSGHALIELGKIQRRRGDPVAAVATLETAVERMRMVVDHRCMVRALAALGTALIDAGRQDRAWDVLCECLEMVRSIHDHNSVRVAVAGLARLCAQAQRWCDAATLAAAADRMTRESGVSWSAATVGRRTALHDAIRSALPPDLFEKSWQLGVEMSTDEAAGLAADLCSRVVRADRGQPSPGGG
jgi:predicted ATPase/DNA-binding SARP family transcriptional activator